VSLPRVLYVGTFPPHPGGSSVAAGYLLQVLHDAGYPLSVVTPSSPETAGRAELVDREFPRIALVEVPLARAITSPFTENIDDAERLDHVARFEAAGIKEADRHRPDVVFVGREEFLESVFRWTTMRGLPVIGRVPSGGELVANVYGAAASRYALDMVRKANSIISPAHHIAAGLAKLGLSNIVTIQNPVDMVRFRPAPIDRHLAERLAIEPEHVVVTHASNMKPVKRICDIAAAAAAAVKRDPRLIFLMIGDGPDRAKLEAAVQAFDLAAHFRFTGWLDHAAVGAHLRVTHMALMPSTAEGLASAYLEAMATGLPLLASDVPGAREVVDDGKNGFLFPVGDIAAIADVIVRVAADPHLRQRIGANARAYVERNHRLETAGDRLHAVLTDVMGKKCLGGRKTAPDC